LISLAQDFIYNVSKQLSLFEDTLHILVATMPIILMMLCQSFW
jgi:hypothetical protein